MEETEKSPLAFNPEEVALLERLKNIRESWRDKTTAHSGLIRDTYLRLLIPEGHALTNRTHGISLIQNSLELVEETLQEYTQEEGFEVVADDLQALEEGFQTFAEEFVE